MPRQNRIQRAPGARVVVTIDSIQHTMTEEAFLALLQAGLKVLGAINATRYGGKK